MTLLHWEIIMDQQGWKLRLVILWLLQIIDYFIYIQFLLSSGETNTEVNATGAIIFLIMCIMVWLSFVIKPSISRWLSIIFAVQLVILKTIGTVLGLTSSRPGIFVTEAWGLLAALLIIWYGIKIPKKVNE